MKQVESSTANPTLTVASNGYASIQPPAFSKVDDSIVAATALGMRCSDLHPTYSFALPIYFSHYISTS